MPTEGEKTNPEPEPSPSSENTPSTQPSPDEERKSKEASSGEPSPDDPPAAKAAKSDVQISGTEVTPRYNIYYHESLSSSEDEDYDEDEDELGFDESWIESYSAESNPHWIAIRDACGDVTHSARIAVANYEWHSKRAGCQFDTKRLERITSQLTTLSKDLEELVTVTTPHTMFPGCDVNSILKLIRFLSEMGVAEVRGKIDTELLISIYKGFKVDRRVTLGEMTCSRLKAFQCIQVWEKYRAAFVGFYEETRTLKKTQGKWGDVSMSEKDLLTWNKEMKELAMTAMKLLRNIRGIVEPLISQLGIYLDKRKELKTQLADFLGVEVPTVYREKIVLV